MLLPLSALEAANMQPVTLTLAACVLLLGTSAGYVHAEGDVAKDVRDLHRDIDKGVDHDAKEIDKGYQHDKHEVEKTDDHLDKERHKEDKHLDKEIKKDL
ncbi:hypothetical protein [Pseudomonas pseudonitroreducens]|uniref:hypothetical protein n=2 Tax=Pseudomonas pseudonitroreducens TaxID=2892326 RepID=UPI001F364BBB